MKLFFLFSFVVTLMACGGSGTTIGSEQSPTDPGGAMLSGTWTGTWLSQTGVGGTTSSSFTQSGNTLTGTITFTNSPCFASGSVSGTVSGSDFVATVTAGEIRVDLSGTLASGQFSGTYRATKAGACTGDTGTFSAQR